MTDGTPPRTTEIQVDELRQQLRALGYLDAGVDRFVLGPARGARAPLTIATLAALRVGLIAGALLGPAAALGIRYRLPGLMTGPRDAVVVALYLGFLFAAAAAFATFLASLAAAKLPLATLTRHAQAASRAAGIFVGGSCLLYLTLWWRIAAAGAAPVTPVWTASALVVAVIISLLLGHTAAITVLAVLVARRGHVSSGAVERARRHWRLTLGGGALAFAGAWTLLVLASPQAAPSAAAPPMAVVSQGLRVRVIALDGFDPAIAQALAAQGTTPTLARILASPGATIAPDENRDPARVWTTIATGQPADVHGVYGLETRRVAGLEGSVASGEPAGLGRALRGATDLLRLTRPSIASGNELRSKTFWEVAADAGLRAAVINWWATWPAVSDAGPAAPLIVSDRAALRLEHGGALDAEIAPAGLYEQLKTEWPAITSTATATIASHLPPPASPALRRAAEVDAMHLALSARLEDDALDLLVVYLPGLDIAQHALIGSAAAGASDLSHRLEELRRYYVYLDRLLQDVTSPASGEMIVVLTQPGRTASATSGRIAVIRPATEMQASETARDVDVAPTVLHALGIPISRELAGAPVLELFNEDSRQRFPVRIVESYGSRVVRATRGGQPLDQEMIERLRSLGYVR